ncbi:hypothetical protein D3C78_1171730 [compost metagenome]
MDVQMMAGGSAGQAQRQSSVAWGVVAALRGVGGGDGLMHGFPTARCRLAPPRVSCCSSPAEEQSWVRSLPPRSITRGEKSPISASRKAASGPPSPGMWSGSACATPTAASCTACSSSSTCMSWRWRTPSPGTPGPSWRPSAMRCSWWCTRRFGKTAACSSSKPSCSPARAM